MGFALGFFVGLHTVAFFGLPDIPSDALLIASVWAIWNRKLWMYVGFATLMVLTREAYVAVCFMIFLVTVLKWWDWTPVSDGNLRSPDWHWKTRLNPLDMGKNIWSTLQSPVGAMIVALPGIVFVGWHFWIYLNLDMLPIQHGMKDPNIISTPFVAMFTMLFQQIRENDLNELLKIMPPIFVYLSCFLILLATLPTQVISWGLILYVYTLSKMGMMVWFDYGGYAKAITALIFVLAFYMAFVPKWTAKLIQALLVLVFLQGLVFQIYQKLL